MTTEYASGAVVYRIHKGQLEYLLLQSATDDFWGLPKGHVEANENLVETAVREIAEETSLDTEIDDGFHNRIEYDMKNGNHKVVDFFVSRVPEGVVIKKQDEEIHSYAWFDYKQACHQLTYDNLRELLAAADKYIRSKEGIEVQP